MPIQYYKGKPPTLQFKILDLLIDNGYVSRPMIKDKGISENYADIHSAIKSLIDYEIIQEYDRKFKKEENDSPGGKKSRGSKYISNFNK